MCVLPRRAAVTRRIDDSIVSHRPLLCMVNFQFLKVCWCYSNDDVAMAEGARGGVVSHTDSAVLDHTGHQCRNFLWRSGMRECLQGAVRSFIARLLLCSCHHVACCHRQPLFAIDISCASLPVRIVDCHFLSVTRCMPQCALCSDRTQQIRRTAARAKNE